LWSVDCRSSLGWLFCYCFDFDEEIGSESCFDSCVCWIWFVKEFLVYIVVGCEVFEVGEVCVHFDDVFE